MDAEYARRLRQQLSHDHIRNLLVQAGLLLLARELVRAAVVDDVKGFFCDEMDEEFNPLSSEEYRTEVLGHEHQNEFAACLDWLVAQEVLSAEHLETIDLLKAERDRVAHEPLALIVDPDFDLDARPILAATEVLRAIGVFFGRLAVDADPRFDRLDVVDADIQSGKSVVYSEVLAVVRDLFRGA